MHEDWKSSVYIFSAGSLPEASKEVSKHPIWQGSRQPQDTLLVTEP